MQRLEYGPHELIEVHEVLFSEITAAQKLQQAMDQTQDKELKSFIQTSLDRKQRRIGMLSQLTSQAMQAQTQQQQKGGQQ